MLAFQRLDAYQCSIRLALLCSEVAGALPRGQSALADQLRRASISVPLNIAEATGRATTLDTSRHHAIARGSAMECAACMDLALEFGLVPAEIHTEAINLIARIASMLTKLCMRTAEVEWRGRRSNR